MSNTRNVNILEQHIEKLLVLLAVGVLGWVAYAYWLQDPYTIQLNGQTVRPSQIDKTIHDEAVNLETQLKSSELPPLLKKVTVPDYNGDFEVAMQKDVISNPEFAQTGLAVVMKPSTDTEGGGKQGVWPKYYVPTVPAPTMYAARADLNTVVPTEFDSRDGLVKIFAPGGPYDFAYASIRAQFDTKKMFQELTFKPEDGVVKPLQPGVWSPFFWIVDVQVERQELDADGNWSDAILLPPIPGQPSFRSVQDADGKMEKISEIRNFKPEFAKELIQKIGESEAEIIQPTPLKMVKPWSPPEPKVEETEQDGNQLGLAEIKRQLKLKEVQIKNFKIQLDRLNRAGSGAKTPAGAAPRGGFDSGLEGGYEGGSIGGVTGGAAATTGKQRQQQRLQERIQAVQQEMQQLQLQYQQKTGTAPPSSSPIAPGGFPGGSPLEGGEFGPGGFDPTQPGGFDSARSGIDPRTGRPIPGANYEEQLYGGEFGPEGGVANGRMPTRPSGSNVFTFGEESVELYAHDLKVKSGKTYRYRVRVLVYNPLFKQQMDAEQAKEMKEKFTLASDWSEWSEPVAVESMSHYWLVNGSSGSARFKVFKFFTGNWREGEFTVRAGDPIGWPMTLPQGPKGQPLDVDFSTGAYVVDVQTIEVPGRIRGMTRKTTRVLVIDNDVIEARTVEGDRDDPKLRRLQDQKAMRDATASVSAR